MNCSIGLARYEHDFPSVLHHGHCRYVCPPAFADDGQGPKRAFVDGQRSRVGDRWVKSDFVNVNCH